MNLESVWTGKLDELVVNPLMFEVFVGVDVLVCFSTKDRCTSFSNLKITSLTQPTNNNGGVAIDVKGTGTLSLLLVRILMRSLEVVFFW